MTDHGATAPTSATTPFSTIRVLELGRVFSAPLCGMMLADLGARVTKIERPGVGDESRQFGRYHAGGASAYFNSLNRNKTSLALDLKDPADRARFVGLVEESDVLVHNWLQGSLDKLGFGYEAVRALNPRIVYAVISGFGYGSPFSSQPAQDIVAQAMSGFLSLTGEPDGVPYKTGIPVVDYVTGCHAAFGIMAALHARQITGEGRLVTTSLLESALAMTSFESSAFLSLGVSPSRNGNRHAAICPYNVYRTSDSHVVLAVANRPMWERFCHALGLDDLVDDPRFDTNGHRLEHQDTLEARLDEVMAAHTADELIALMEAARVSCTRINSIAEAFEAAPVETLDMAISSGGDDPVAFVGPAVHLEGVDPGPVTMPPRLGEDGE